MSSGFVPAGTNDEPVERDDEWLKAQQELEEERRRKAEIGKQADGKSLYEVLQQNKMAKQEAFEEKIRLKNQFRSLDEDEVEFLDSVLESTRAQEAAVKRDTAEQLELFRRQREEAEKASLGPTSSEVAPTQGEEWAIPARKRRRDKKKDLLIPGKKRKASVPESGGEKVGTSKEQEKRKSSQEPVPTDGKHDQQAAGPAAPASSLKDTPEISGGPVSENNKLVISAQPEPEAKQPAKAAPLSLGLADYGSDSE